MVQKIIQFMQQQLAQVGIKASVLALGADQCIECVESVPKPGDTGMYMHYADWPSSTGGSDWALRPLLVSEVIPPKSFNIVYYENEQVDANIAGALRATDCAGKSKLYTNTQKCIWEDVLWAFLVTEKIVYACSKRLSGAYVALDGSFSFEDVDVKQ